MLAVCLDGQHFFVWARVSTGEFGNLARCYLAPPQRCCSLLS